MPYLTLDEIPEGRLCRPLFIPDDPLWLALFGGALTELEQPYNYQQFGTLTPQEMADACAAVIAEWYADICASCDLPDGEPIIGVSTDYRFQQLIDGEWQEPTGDYAIPPTPAREEPTSEERICLAAKNAENVLKLMYEEVTDAFGASLGALEALATLAIFVIGAINPAVGLGMKALGLAALGIWQWAFEVAEFVTADFWDEQFHDNLTCALIRNATDTDGVVTFDMDGLNEELITQIEWFDPTASSFALAAQVRWLLGQITVDGLNLAGVTTAITDDDCSFCEGGYYCLINTANMSNTWTLAYGVVDGAVWKPDNSAGFPYLSLRQTINIPLGGTLDRFTFEWDKNGYTGGLSVSYYIYAGSGGGTPLYTATVSAGGANPLGIVGAVGLTNGTFTLQADISTSGGAGGFDPFISNTLFEGTGEPPMEGQVCE